MAAPLLVAALVGQDQVDGRGRDAAGVEDEPREYVGSGVTPPTWRGIRTYTEGAYAPAHVEDEPREEVAQG